MGNQKSSSGSLVFVLAVVVLAVAGAVAYFVSVRPSNQLHQYEQRAKAIESKDHVSPAEADELSELHKRIGELKADGVK